MNKINKAISAVAPYSVLLTGAFLTYTSRGSIDQEQDTACMIAGLYLLLLGGAGLWMQYKNVQKQKNGQINQKSR